MEIFWKKLFKIFLLSLFFWSFATLAHFADFEKVVENTFSSGILDLKIDGKDTELLLEVPNFLPGDEFEKEIEIENQGNLEAKTLLFGVDSNFSSHGFSDQELIQGKIKNFPWIANHPVISEIQISGEGEWIEIYNPTNERVDLKNWHFAYYPSSKASWSDPWRKSKLASGEISFIEPFGFFLFRVDGKVLEADGDSGYQGEADTLSDIAGSVAIFKGEVLEENLVDAIGWGNTFLNLKEGNSAKTPKENQSLERKSGGKHQEDKGNGFDTNDNLRDFQVKEIPQPQNSSSLPEFPF
jgi:hypothetical protein